MPRHAVALDLPASRERVWELVTDPDVLPRWWPGIVDAEPRTRELRPGSRWHVRGADRPRLIRAPETTGELVVLAVEAPTHLAWRFTGDGIDADLRLDENEPGRTTAVLAVEGPPLVGLRRSVPRNALARLRRLCERAQR